MTKHFLHLAALITPLVLVSAADEDGGSSGKKSGVEVAGSIRFTGAVPKPRAVTTTDGGTIQHSDLVVHARTKGLRDVFVVVEDAPVQPKVEEVEPAVVDQRDWVFVPRVVAVRHGQAVRFDNSDQVNHSVMAASTVKENQFNAIATPGMPVTHVFEPQRPPVQIGCALHPWMRAWVYVVRHPWFAVTDVEGRFRLADVPPGKYQLLLTHPDTGLRERRHIEVRAGQALKLDIEWNRLPEARKP